MNDARGSGGDPRRDPIWRWIRAIMLADVAIGIALAIYGLTLVGAGDGGRSGGPFVTIGVALALIGAGLWFFFGALAKRRARQMRD